MDIEAAACSQRAFDRIAFSCPAHSLSPGETDIKGLQGTVRASGGEGERKCLVSKDGKWLRRNGAAFHYGRRIDPARLLAVRILLALLGLLALSRVSVWAGIGGLACLFFLPVLLLDYLNRRDNERMLPELKLVYHALEIQIQAGVYVTDALAVTSPKLK